MDGQRWKNNEQRNEAMHKNLTREQIEAGKATVGYATTHAGHPEEVQQALNTDTQPVRIGEQQFQKEHNITHSNQIGGENQLSVAEEIRANHGLEKDQCEGCGKNQCRGCGSFDADKIGMQKQYLNKKAADSSSSKSCEGCSKGECKDENCTDKSNKMQKDKSSKGVCAGCSSNDCKDSDCLQKNQNKNLDSEKMTTQKSELPKATQKH